MTTLTRRGWRGDKRTEPEEDAAGDREQPDDDSDNSKATRLTLMEEVLLLGLQDKEVSEAPGEQRLKGLCEFP